LFLAKLSRSHNTFSFLFFAEESVTLIDIFSILLEEPDGNRPKSKKKTQTRTTVTGSMKQDRLEWNEKYRTHPHPANATGIVKRFYHLAPGKKVLDIAAGTGRHAIFLARKGFSVDAVDISEAGLVGFAGKYPNIHAICADLDQFEIPADRYDLIVDVNFMNRRLFPYIQEGLKPGGVVIFHTLLEPDDIKSTPKHRRDYRLRTNELLHAFLGMRIVYYSETVNPETSDSDRTATLVGVKK